MPSFEDYTVVISASRRRDGTEWTAAQVAELPGCIAEGGSEAEAREALRRIFPEYVMSLIRDGVAVPGPKALGGMLDGTRFR